MRSRLLMVVPPRSGGCAGCYSTGAAIGSWPRVRRQERVDRRVAAKVLLEVERAQYSVAHVAAALGDADRGGVLGIDVELDALQAEHVERPVRHEPQGALRDAAAARLPGGHVADLALLPLCVEVDDRDEPQEGAVAVDDREAGP